VVRGLFDLARTILQFYTVAVLVYALLSWVAPGNDSPATRLLGRLCEPLLRPVRRVVPPIGGLDFSALFVLIGLQALQILLADSGAPPRLPAATNRLAYQSGLRDGPTGC
jgi:YggT family protein